MYLRGEHPLDNWYGGRTAECERIGRASDRLKGECHGVRRQEERNKESSLPHSHPLRPAMSPAWNRVCTPNRRVILLIRRRTVAGL